MTSNVPKTIGVLSSSLNAYFVRRLYRGLEDSLRGRGYRLQVFETSSLKGPHYHRFIDDLAERRDLAGLVYGHLRLSVNQVARFKQRGIRVVACTERMEGIDWVTVDEKHGAWLATRWLLGAGHQRIALVNGPLLTFQARQREAGFIQALDEVGIDFSKQHGVNILNFSEEEGFDAGNFIFDMADRPSAVFVAAGDVTAVGLLHAFRDRGLQFPEDVSVVGFDNLEFAARLCPALTTVNQPLEEMGAWAGRRLIQAIQAGQNHRPEGKQYAAEMVLRGSARPLAGDFERDQESMDLVADS